MEAVVANLQWWHELLVELKMQIMLLDIEGTLCCAEPLSHNRVTAALAG